MAIIRGKLTDIQTIPSSVGVLYANSSSTETFIGGFTLFNSNNITETVKLYCVPDSSGSLGTAVGANQILEIQLAALETFTFDFPADGLVLSDQNDSVQGVTTTASKVTIIFHGLKAQ